MLRKRPSRWRVDYPAPPAKRSASVPCSRTRASKSATAASSTDEEKFISGELYSINNPLEFSWAIGQLDDYEGLNTEEDETPLYKREEVIAYQNGEPYIAWIYWFNGDLSSKPEIESGDLLQYLQQKNKP